MRLLYVTAEMAQCLILNASSSIPGIYLFWTAFCHWNNTTNYDVLITTTDKILSFSNLCHRRDGRKQVHPWRQLRAKMATKLHDLMSDMLLMTRWLWIRNQYLAHHRKILSSYLPRRKLVQLTENGRQRRGNFTWVLDQVAEDLNATCCLARKTDTKWYVLLAKTMSMAARYTVETALGCACATVADPW